MSKHIFYDWLGYNGKIFHHIHHLIENHNAIKIMELLSNALGYYKLFPLHLALFAMVALFITRKSQHPNNRTLEKYIKTSLLICCTMFLSILICTILKNTLAFPRPFCTGALINKTVAAAANHASSSCSTSTPSGHTLYATTFILSMWGILNKPFKIFFAIVVILMPISRVILGFHFPADTVYGIAIAIAVVSTVKRYAYQYITKITKLLMEKFYKTHQE